MRKQRMAEKQYEQEQQQKAKELLLMEEEAQAQQISKKKLHRDRILNVMYRNPEVFKVSTIIQTIARLKKGSADQEADGTDGIPAFIISSSDKKPEANPQICKGIAMETIRRTMDDIKPFYREKPARNAFTSRQDGQTPAAKSTTNRSRPLITGGLDFKRALGDSTKGLHFHKQRSKKLMGGIFAVIRLKKQIDEFEKTQGIKK